MTPNRRQVIVGATALASGMAALRTEAGSISPRALLVLGDWGRENTHQHAVAKQMNIAAAERNCVGVVTVGDNFYEDGVVSVDDPKWRTYFEDVYSGPSLKPLPWYATLGNHDYGSAPQAQVAYSEISERWHMPERYYRVSGAGLGMPGLDLFILDTNPLIADNAKGDDQMAVNVRTQDGDAQLVWLDRALAASQARYKIVVGHHTLYSGGSLHGNTPELITKLLPILRRHRVVAYVNGHDHDLQHIVRDEMHFICSGAGAESRPVHAITGTHFCLSRSGFALLSLDEQGLSLEFRDYKGKTPYQTRLSA
ncbi:MAG: tartrate-resistant acid phosphatase type 5 family protein [Asticcacaulis sp.]